MSEYKGRGGWRGGGRPRIDPKDSKARPNHGMKASWEEWAVIKRFKKCLEKNPQKATASVEALENEVF